jgi:hypothetical protein
MNRSNLRCLALIGTFLVGSVTGAMAQDITKEHLASARAAIEASRVADGFDNILVSVALQTKTLFQRSNPALTSQIDEVTNAVALELAARRPELDRDVQTIWAKKFTKAELDEVSKFYNSPTGKKLATETQGIVQQSMQSVAAWQQKISSEMVNRVREEMKKRGYNL